MKYTKKLLVMALSVSAFAACRKEAKLAPPEEQLATESLSFKQGGDKNQKAGHVYTLGNQAGENRVMEYVRGTDGKLSFHASYATGGKGTGSGLGSQGSVILADGEDGETILLAVNAGSNTISSFTVSKTGLRLVSVIRSGGIQPISLAQYGGLVYVVNTGGDGNISGFRLSDHGKLYPIPFSTRKLSSANAGPAQISFVNEGRVLVVTEKNNNKIVSWTVNRFGIPGIFHWLPSANKTPFGFATGSNGKLFVSEAAGGADAASSVSAYQVLYDGSIRLVNGPVATTQTAACWVVLTDNQKYVYATNTGSNSVTSFTASGSGRITLANTMAAPTGMTPIDAALSEHSNYLYVLNANGKSISAFAINDSGVLSVIETETGLPAGDVGLAAE